MITLRRGPQESPFRELLLALCSANTGGGLLLCSGYIWEETSGYAVSVDGLAAAIARGVNPHDVELVGIKNSKPGTKPDWEKMFKDFVSALRGAAVRVRPQLSSSRNWHAKAAVRFDDEGNPVAGILGSSNLTGPAFAINRPHSWNYEADVTLWVDGSSAEQPLKDAVSRTTDRYGKMFLELARGVDQPDERAWLRTFEKDVMSDDSLKPLEE